MTIDALPLLLVDDEPSVLHSSRLLLTAAGIKPIITLQDSTKLMQLLSEQEVSAIVLDLFMPDLSGIELLPQILSMHPQIPVIVMTAAQDVSIAVQCMKDAAFDYLVKPVEESRFLSSVKRAIELRQLRRHATLLKEYLLTDQLKNQQFFKDFDSHSKRMHAIFQYVEAISSSTEPVLITGATGVGKEVMAKAIHHLSGRKGEMVSVNVAGLDDILFSDTLFGHKKGAFTGAESHREGLIERAAGGTLFLDEIGDLTLSSQIKLLRLIQDNRYYPLGSDVAKNSDVRFVCATNQKLQHHMTQGHFRADLFYRLSVHQIELPSLKERMEDLPLLVQRFIENACQDMGKNISLLAPSELYDLLANYEFPGNIRELRALVYDAVATHRSGPFLSLERFRQVVKNQQSAPPVCSAKEGSYHNETLIEIPGRFPTLTQAETSLIYEALKRSNNNQGVAATLLGISRPALNRRLARLHDSNTPN